MLAPPAIDCADLCVCFGCRSDRQVHRRRRSASSIAEAGWSRPPSAESQDAESASCSSRRSSSMRSSPSSSSTKSSTVPSGRVVGSSSTKRPFGTRARRGVMWLLYGVFWAHGKGQAARANARSAATRRRFGSNGSALGTPNYNPSLHGLLGESERETFRDPRQIYSGNGLVRCPISPLIPEDDPRLDRREAHRSAHVDLRPWVIGAIQHSDDGLGKGRGKKSVVGLNAPCTHRPKRLSPVSAFPFRSMSGESQK